MELISLAVIIILWFLFLIILANWEDMPQFITGVLFVLFFCYGVDGGSENINHTTTVEERELVSVVPPQQEINGSISGNFLFFSGTIGQDTFYLLRERISENTYLDFKVVNGAYIVEDDKLKDTGRFVQEFICYEEHATYRVLWWNVIDMKVDRCDFVKQSIVVPKGTVIKNMGGI
jgi:hypothetical protein